jgi:hypothetical protein
MFGACQDTTVMPPPDQDVALSVSQEKSDSLRGAQRRDSIRKARRNSPTTRMRLAGPLGLNECYVTDYQRDPSDSTRLKFSKITLAAYDSGSGMTTVGTTATEQSAGGKPGRLLYWRRKRATKQPTLHANCVIPPGEAARVAATAQLAAFERIRSDVSDSQGDQDGSAARAEPESGEPIGDQSSLDYLEPTPTDDAEESSENDFGESVVPYSAARSAVLLGLRR